MLATHKRKTSVALDAQLLDHARQLDINVSVVAEQALQVAIRQAKNQQWLVENAQAFAEQARWHERNGHPLSDIIASSAASSWDN
jgi:antitoxin CcdA